MKKTILMWLWLPFMTSLYGQHDPLPKTLWQTLDCIISTRYRMDSYTYDSLGRNDTWVVTMADQSGQSFYNAARHRYIYDHNNWIVEEYDDDANDQGPGWVNYRKYRYHHHTDGRDSLKYTDKWNSSTSTWSALFKSEYTYLPNGSLAEILTSNWYAGGSVWQPKYRYTKTYNTAGYVIEELSEGWDYSQNQWKGESRNLYVYNAQNQEVMMTIQLWGWVYSGAWGDYSRSVHTYGPTGDITEIIGLDYDTYYGTWSQSYRALHHHDFTFPASNVLIPVSVKRGEHLAKDYFLKMSKFLYCETYYRTLQNTWLPTGDSLIFIYSDFGTGIQEKEASTGFTIYPNPASDYITVNGLDPTTSYTIHIYDLTGKELIRHASPHHKVNISELEAGVFVVEIRTDKGLLGRQKLIRWE